MTTRRTKPKTYSVANPHGIPKDIPILQFGDHEWFEGDDYIPPADAKAESIAKKVAKGFLIDADAEKADG